MSAASIKLCTCSIIPSYRLGEMCHRLLRTLTRLLPTGFTRSFNETRSLPTWSAHAFNLLRNSCELISLANDTWLSTEGDLCAMCYDHTTSRKPWERVRMTLFSVPPLVHRSLHPSRLAPFSTALISDFLLPSLPSMLCGVACLLYTSPSPRDRG